MNWIIVPVRNGLEYTRAALPTFFAQDIGDIAVLFIDNDSTDGTGEFLRAQEGVLYHHQNPALSVAASWNKALQFLFEDGHGAPPYVLVVNNDVELRPDTYRQLVADGGLFVTAVGHQDRSAINPIMLFGSGKDQRPVKPYWTPPDPGNKRPHPDMSCFLMRRECWERVGQFDEQFSTAYCEDLDYDLRMRQSGITAMALELPFYHVKSGTLKSASPEEKGAIMKHAEENRAKFKAKWGVGAGSPEYYTLLGTTREEEAKARHLTLEAGST